MIKCRHCGCEELSKDGIIKGKQRYKCKRCKRTTRENDQRYKYSISTRLRVLKGYLEGVGIMALERLTGVPNPLIIKWIRNYAKILGELIAKATVSKKLENVEILEMDELFTYCKKNNTESMFGLLLTETETKFLILK